jgi:hypothetical protein
MRLNFYVLVAVVIGGYFACVGLRHLLRRLEEVTPPVERIRLIASPAVYCALIVAIIVGMRLVSTFVYVRF